MKNPVLIAGALVVALIAGYGISLLMVRPLTGPCNGPNEHCIHVKISDNVIKVDALSLAVDRPNVPPHKIYWLIDSASTPGYAFAAGAISSFTPVPPTTSLPANEFSNCGPSPQGDTFSCKDANSQPGTYKYTVTVTGSPAVPALDPWIVNQ